jgi:hypothetical protein
LCVVTIGKLIFDYTANIRNRFDRLETCVGRFQQKDPESRYAEPEHRACGILEYETAQSTGFGPLAVRTRIGCLKTPRKRKD